MVILDKIQENNEPAWNALCTKEMDVKSRTGIPISLAQHDMGLATIIGNTGRDAGGHKIGTEMRSKIDRLRIWDYRIQPSSDRNLRYAFNELAVLKHKLGLSNVAVEKSAYIYRKAQKRGFVLGRTIPSVMAAAVYITCREMEIPRTLNDVTRTTNIRWKILSRTVRQLLHELDYKVPNTDPVKYIVKIANKLNLSERSKRQAMSIMSEVTRSEILDCWKRSYGICCCRSLFIVY